MGSDIISRAGMVVVGEAARPVPGVAGLEAREVSLEVMRSSVSSVGGENLMITLVPVDGGYEFRMHAPFQPKRCSVLCAERSGDRRVFKSVEAALNVARTLGFSAVVVSI